MPHGDILPSYFALLCLGNSAFKVIDALREDVFFGEALGPKAVFSPLVRSEHNLASKALAGMS